MKLDEINYWDSISLDRRDVELAFSRLDLGIAAWFFDTAEPGEYHDEKDVRQMREDRETLREAFALIDKYMSDTEDEDDQ